MARRARQSPPTNRGRYDAQLISGQAASTARRPCSIECASIAEEQLKHYEILPVRPATTDGEICAAHLAESVSQLTAQSHTVTPSHVCLVLELSAQRLGRPGAPSPPQHPAFARPRPRPIVPNGRRALPRAAVNDLQYKTPHFFSRTQFTSVRSRAAAPARSLPFAPPRARNSVAWQQ